ncbi:hypothetical protein FBY40_2514 [Microbacterium sp. SLBN-154]|uniref:DUF6264 family protein n=1 Tax=Microbacterium sp. SLBN-154 TaxID=2768458 RepID=UPI0011530196|nr:DUF6264 family protein [Microbacterium sp. SLBN-154]TQK19995.1 hypothetical protein FBY40_2514 [Microbacterium sp. SLBN-154]
MTDGSDPRPRPQYGEYATPEEQRARIQQPDVTVALEAGAAPAAAASREPTPTPTSTPAKEAGPDLIASRRRFFDRVLTIALLIYAVFSVATAIPGLVDYNGYVQTLFEFLGVTEAPDPTFDGRAWGVAASLVLGVGLLLTAAVSWIMLQRGKITFWVPIVGGVVFNLISGALLMVPLLNDPALMGALLSR